VPVIGDAGPRVRHDLDLVAGRAAFGRTFSRKDRRLFLPLSRRTVGIARVHALFEESARQSERRPKVFARGLEAAAAKLKLAERSRVERISSKAIAVNDRANLIEPPLGSFALSNRDGPVERHDRRRLNRHQQVI
jgi:hypothetical protein